MSQKLLFSLFIVVVVAVNIEALVLGSRRSIYSPRRTIVSSISDADTVNIGFGGGSSRRVTSLSSVSNLGLGLNNRRSFRPRISSGLRRRNNIVVLGGGDIDFPSFEYGGSLGGIGSLGGLGGYEFGGDADHVTVPRGTNLRLAARTGLFEDADQISVI